MKYRVLTNEELTHFEQDLKAFLIVHGIDGALWARINQQEPEKALQLVEVFSDQILQTIYEKIHYLEHRAKNSLLIFHLGKEIQELIAIQTSSEDVDLSTPESIHHALMHQFKWLQFFQSSKKYEGSREAALHQLLEQGAVPSTESFWNALMQVI
jgi:hypothetical protein